MDLDTIVKHLDEISDCVHSAAYSAGYLAAIDNPDPEREKEDRPYHEKCIKEGENYYQLRGKFAQKIVRAIKRAQKPNKPPVAQDKTRKPHSMYFTEPSADQKRFGWLEIVLPKTKHPKPDVLASANRTKAVLELYGVPVYLSYTGENLAFTPHYPEQANKVECNRWNQYAKIASTLYHNLLVLHNSN